MGQLADALRVPQQRRALQRGGGSFEYTDALEMVRDMAALRRAFPEVRLLPSDDLIARRVGYLAYRTEGDQEIVFNFTLPVHAVEAITEQLVREYFKSAEGRRRILQAVENLAQQPEPVQEEEVARRSAWSRLMDDDSL